MTKENNTYKEVWDVLSKVDVSERIETKAGLSYLSWAWAWGVLMEHYPDAQYLFLPEFFYPDESCKVECIIDIRGATRSMWLPVMDYRNNAITNPNARQISDSKMRCLVKNISMFGLGHYLYAGEDLPDVSDLEPKATPKKKAPKKKASSSNSAVEIVKEVLGAKEIPDFSRISKTDTIEELRDIFSKNKDKYESLGEKVFAVIRKEFTDRKLELKKGETNGTAKEA